MSLKQNVNFIKEEISTEEQFFESFFKLEKYYKKYKVFIYTFVVVVLGYFIGTNILNYIQEQNIIKANNTYSKVLANPNNKAALNNLKEQNKILYQIALYQISQDKTKPVNVDYLKDITAFNKAIESNDINSLNSLILKENFVLRDYALFNKALILTSQNKYKKAKKTLESIQVNSSVEPLAKMLKHYLLTK